MKRLIKPILCAVMAAAMFTNAGAVSTQEIQAKMEAVKTRRNQAHQMAEYVRSYGEDDTHPAIQFAKDKWWELNGELITLCKKYNEAKERERLVQEIVSRGSYLGQFRISHYCTGSCCNGG